MATHDYVLDNASGAAFRTDLNNALAAIVSNNSNGSSPATTYAYQWWADTSAGVLKIRNSANNAWIELLQLDGTLTLEDGSASTPALAFRDDLNTGIFSSAADTFDIATAGVARLQLDASETTFNEDGVDTDFRIEGDTDTRLFFLDAGTDRIGIGVDSAPLSKLHVQDVEGTTLTLGNTAAAASDGDYLSGIDFHIKDNNDTTGATCASIRTFADQNHTASAKGTALALFTVDDDTTTLDERLRITHNGNVGIGTTTPTSPDGSNADNSNNGKVFTIYGDSPAINLIHNTAGGASAGSTDYAAINFGRNGSSSNPYRAVIGYKQSDDILRISANNHIAFDTGGDINANERMRIDSSGRLMIGVTSTSHASTNADDLCVGNNDSSSESGITLGSTAASTIRFADSASGSAGIIEYAHSADTMKFTTATSVRLTIDGSGNIGAPSGTNIYNASDLRLKKNVVDLDKGLSAIKSLRPISFNWIDGFCDEEKQTLYGFIAQEVENVDINLVQEFGSGTVTLENQTIDNALTVNEKFIIPMLVKAIQELEVKVAALEAA
tara:strand:+ start:77 stop:1741 length:1665 start_codon:yes stop_codon:yes gene_type:complete